MHLSHLTAQNFRQFGDGGAALHLSFQNGITALVGRNDSGKTAIIDAIRYALLTRDQEFIRVQRDDFHIDRAGKEAGDISIVCKLTNLDSSERAALIEYLSYESGDVSLIVNWTARRLPESPGARRWAEVTVRSGVGGTGPALESSARELLAAAYLRPLRDAEREMSPGRGSRLSQVLANVPEIKDGDPFDPAKPLPDAAGMARLSLLGLSDHFIYHAQRHGGVGGAEDAINTKYLAALSLLDDRLLGKIDLADDGTPRTRLQQILERLELRLREASSGATRGRFGLGSNNLLFIACELLLLGREPEGLPLLLVEEPEAHLHPQRQLRLMQFLSQAAAGSIQDSKRRIQVILSTHSPNLASKIPLGNLVLLEGRQAFSLAESQTKLDKSDYRFLERFLDVTKANLFFAHGVMIVEGDAEAILLPALAKAIGVDLTEHGVSIVNVGGVGLKRFSRIFQRSSDAGPFIAVPIACLADMDVMPDCAPEILGLVTGDADPAWQSATRRWKALRDFGAAGPAREAALATRRKQLQANDGQLVKTFIADHWTLEHDLAFSGLTPEVYASAILAKNDDPLNEDRKTREEVLAAAGQSFADLKITAAGDQAKLAAQVYRLFHSREASKAIAAQHLAEIVDKRMSKAGFDQAAFAAKLPRYIVEAINHVVRGAAPAGAPSSGSTANG